MALKTRKNKFEPVDSNITLLNANTPFNINESYRATRTNIGFLLTDEGCKCISVTSPSPGEGKSTNCLNLAITFGLTGARVLVVDTDLRRPRIHKMLDLKQKPGVTNILGGFCQIKEGIKTTQYKNLDAITSGDIPPNPAELLSSKRMIQLIDVLKEHYDYIFFDCPPVNVVTDAIVLSKYMSGVILVARQGVTSTDTMGKAVEGLTFAGAKVLGFIFNDVRKFENYRYRYKFKDKYGYYTKDKYEYYADVEKESSDITEGV